MSSDPTDHNAQPTNAQPQDVLDAEAARFLASLQQRLSQTQNAAAELKNRESAIAEQAKALEARRAQIESQERELHSRLNQFAVKSASIEDRERAVAQAAAELQERKREIERAEAESVAERDRLIAEGKAAQHRMEAEAKAKAEVLAVGIERARAATDARRAEVDQSAKLLEARAEQTERREQELEAREGELARESAALAAKLNKVEDAAAALAGREKAVKVLAENAERAAAEHASATATIEKDRAAVQKLRAEVEKAERSVRAASEEGKAAADAAAQRKAELDRREGAVLTREQQLRAAQDELERRRVFVSQCEAQSTQLEATSRHLREQAEQIKVSAERQVAQWQDKATEAQFQADSSQQQAQKLQEQLAVAQKRARALEEEIDQVKVLGISVSPEAQGRIDGLSKRAETAEQRAATLQEIIDQHSDEVAKAESRYDAVARQLDEAQRVLNSTGDAHAQQMLAWQKQAEKAAADVAASLAQTQRAQADAERASAELNDHRQRAAQAEERARALTERVAAAEQAAQQADERAHEAAAQAAESAKGAAGPADESQLNAARERVAELEAAAKKREAELAELRARATVAEAAGSGGEGFNAEQRRRLESELAQREEALGVLANRLLNSEERVLAMQAQLDKTSDELHAWEERGTAAGVSHAPAQVVTVVHDGDPAVVASDSRRRRLRRVRELLAQEHRKVLLAKEALGRHKAEADAVLQQRARLSQMAQSLQAAEVEANKTRAKSSAASVIIAAMMALITVSGISYLAASVLSPSLYAAKATLAADSDGRSPTDQQKRVWMSAHERLATDVQVYTVAAEKFQQRGMRDLSNPGAVQERFANSVALISDIPGQITFELRGIGRDNTERELETFVGALSAVANSRRETRSDGLGTIVSKQAEAGIDPLDSKRQTAMLIALGAGLVASWGAGFGVYRLMTRVRKLPPGEEAVDAFERSATIGKVGPQRPGSAAA